MSKQDPPWSRLEKAKRRLDASHGALKNGDSYRSAELTVMKYLEALRAIAPADGNALSPREREVLALIASGKSSREVATVLGISFKTVLAHRYHLHLKLRVHKNVDLMRVALRMGLVRP